MKTRVFTVIGAVLLWATLSCGGQEDRSYSAVLITLDTTRADAISVYGAPAGLTPNIDRLAAESLRFDAARTVVPLTLPAHASMLTGLIPPRHTLRDNGLTPLPSAANTLAELARSEGLETAAFLGAVVLDPVYGLDQGFDVYDTPSRKVERTSGHFGERSATEVVDSAIGWLDGRDPERRFFLWVHLFDAHAPYAPPVESPEAPTPYLGEVAFQDRELGRLLDRLEPLLAETVVLLTADHGEGLGEHQEATHGAFCWDSTMRVPFLLRDPEGHRAGEVAASIVSVVDVYPTLATAIGATTASEIDGVDLFRRPVPADRGMYFESYYGWISYGWAPLAGWVDGEGKYFHGPDPLLVDPRSDPAESTNLTEARGDESRLYRRKIGASLALPALEPDIAVADSTILKDLEGLGYVGGSRGGESYPNPLASTDRPSALARQDEQNRTLSAKGLSNRGLHAEAVVAFEEILRENPNNWVALDRQGYDLLKLGRHAEAVTALRRLVDGGPQWAGTWLNLGLALQGAGEAEEAHQAFMRTLELDPMNMHALARVIDHLTRSGRAEEALPLRERLREAVRASGGVPAPGD